MWLLQAVDQHFRGASRARSVRTASGELLQIVAFTGERGPVRIADVDLIPSRPIAVHASRPRDPEVADRQSLQQRRRSDVILGDYPVLALALGAKLLEAANHATLGIAHAPAEQILEKDLIRPFRHAPCLPAAAR